MEYRCNKHLWYINGIAILLIGLIGGGRLICIGISHQEGLIVAIGIAIMSYVVWQCTAGCIYYGKRIRLGPNGCTVSFLGAKKFYPWEFYETKRYQKSKHNRQVGIYEGQYVIIFCSKLYKKDLAFPLLHCLHFSPFKSFCLGFYPEQRNDLVKMFSADSETIRTLRKWGLEIQNLPE